MSVNEIRQTSIERERAERKAERREEIIELAEGFIGFGGLIFICFMLSVIGG